MPAFRPIRCWRRESASSPRGATATRAGTFSLRLPAISRPIHRPNARDGYVRPSAHPPAQIDPRRRTKEATMTTKLAASVLLCLMSGTAMAQEPKVTTLFSKDLAENPGKEVLMISVEHAPGGTNAIHRHNAHAFVYVLEGSVVMQLKGGPQVTLTPGQTFYEGLDDIHLVDRNASSTNPAKFLVLLIKDKGAPAVIPVK